MAEVSNGFMRGIVRVVILFLCVLNWCELAVGQTKDQAITSCESAADASTPEFRTNSPDANRVPPILQRNLGRVRATSFPELQARVVNSRTFNSSADYFRTRFSISRFLFFRRMHYFVEMNPRIEKGGPAAEGTCAILAHELVHIVRMSEGNRMHLLGLVRLASDSYTARFERSADLEAIRRGYGPGLVVFREWVYKNIPANAVKRKKRNYFSPEEIVAILQATKSKPELFAYWDKHVPLSLEQIESSAKNAR
jgi:hypothetical protein